MTVPSDPEVVWLQIMTGPTIELPPNTPTIAVSWTYDDDPESPALHIDVRTNVDDSDAGSDAEETSPEGLHRLGRILHRVAHLLLDDRGQPLTIEQARTEVPAPARGGSCSCGRLVAWERRGRACGACADRETLVKDTTRSLEQALAGYEAEIRRTGSGGPIAAAIAIQAGSSLAIAVKKVLRGAT